MIHKILNNPHNQWILNDKVVSRSLFTFNDLLMPKHHQKLLQSKDIIILPVSGQFSCTVQQPSNSSIVLLFPELIKILSNVDNSRGIAILAHEFGHLYHKHYEKHIPTIKPFNVLRWCLRTMNTPKSASIEIGQTENGAKPSV